jgi:hypothetical protein
MWMWAGGKPWETSGDVNPPKLELHCWRPFIYSVLFSEKWDVYVYNCIYIYTYIYIHIYMYIYICTHTISDHLYLYHCIFFADYICIVGVAIFMLIGFYQYVFGLKFLFLFGLSQLLLG